MITGEKSQGLKDVFLPHLRQSPEQIAGVIEHDSWLTSLCDQLGNQIGHAPVAVRECGCIVVISLVRMIEHVLQVRDQLSVRTGWHRRLMHVQGARECRSQMADVVVLGCLPNALGGLHQGLDALFPSTD